MDSNGTQSPPPNREWLGGERVGEPLLLQFRYFVGIEEQRSSIPDCKKCVILLIFLFFELELLLIKLQSFERSINVLPSRHIVQILFFDDNQLDHGDEQHTFTNLT